MGKLIFIISGLLLSSAAFARGAAVPQPHGHRASYICTGYGYSVMSARHQYRTVYGDAMSPESAARNSALAACSRNGLAACQTTCFDH